jgi:signal transduction histidine kinase
LARATEHTQAVLVELRDLAHGIYPAVLAEAGIGPALATLADTAALPVELVQTENDRYTASVEAAIYFAVAEALSDATRRGAGHVTVTVTQDGELLIVTIEDNEAGAPGAMVAAADRVGALGGSLSTGPGAVRVEIPCAS